MKVKESRKAIKTLQPYVSKQYEDIEDISAEELYTLGTIYLFDDEYKNLTKGFAYIKTSASKNYLEAIAITGFLYEFGIGCCLNYSKAENYYLKASERRHGLAMARLSSLYRYGRPQVKMSRKLSEKYLAYVKIAGPETVFFVEMAAKDYNEPSAQYVLGTFYHDGIYFEKDEHEAVSWYMLSANAQHPRGEGILGYCYGEAVGLEKDVHKALHFYQRAAEKNETVAMYNIGYYLEEGICGEKDIKQAIKWYEEAAKRGNTLACNSLGYLYEEGNGVQKDYEKAKAFYAKAAAAGNAWGCHNLGYLYSMGFSVDQNMHKAVDYYQQAAHQGHSGAQNKLGYYFSNGIGGIEKDESRGIFWYLIAAEQGLATAQVNLAFCYERGCGVAVNYEKAIYWLEIASKQNDSRQNVEQWLASLVMRLCLQRGSFTMNSHILACAA